MLYKKSLLTKILLITCLITPQKSEAFIGWATGLFVTGLAYCTGTYITRHNNASNFVTKQENIIKYITHIYVYPGKHYKQKTTALLEAKTAEEMIQKVLTFAAPYQNGTYSLRASPSLILEDGTIVQLKKVRMNAKKVGALTNTLHARFIVPDSSFHLTYHGKLTLGAIPTLAGAGVGPVGLLLPIILLV